MLYDSLSYVCQIQQLWKEREKEEKQKMTAPEYLSKWKKDDRLMPVITLVFYYDTEQWDGSTDLYGMLQQYNDGIELGREQGIECGMFRGTIEIMKEFGVSMEEAIERIMKKFEITKEQAEKEVEKYWN